MDIHLLDLMLGHLFAMSMDEKRQRKIDSVKEYRQECAEEITAIAGNLFSEIEAVIKRQKAALYPAAITDGAELLVLYAFAKAIKYQGGRLTTEQSDFLGIYFRHFSMPFTKMEFIASATSINAARKQIVKSVGVSRKTIGDFWHALFKLMAVSKCGEDVLFRIIDKYMRMLKRFAALGGINEEAVQPICKQFAVDVLTHYAENRNPPEEKIDIYGEVPPAAHYKRMLDICVLLADKSNSEDSADDVEFIVSFGAAGLIYKIIMASEAGAHQHAEMLDYAMKTGNIEARMNGENIINSIREHDGIGHLIKVMTYPKIEGIWKFVIIMAHEAGMHDEVVSFSYELAGFILGIGTALQERFPKSGAMEAARTNMREALKGCADLL